MRKSKKKIIVDKIKKKDNDVPELIRTYLISNACIKLVITLIIFSLAFVLVENVNKLSFISPHIFFSTSVIFLALMVIFIIFLCYYKYYKDDFMENKTAIRLFDIYDMLSFILMTINILFFIILFVLTPTVVDGSSMNNSYYNNDRLLVWHLGYSPTTNDAVIIDVSKDKYTSLPSKDERFFIKRIVATTSDKVEFKDVSTIYGDLYVNDELVESSISRSQYETLTTYNKTNTSVLDENSCVISGYSIVLGDNRSNSTDSRIIGAINNKDIQGKVVFVFYSENKNFGFPKNNIKE